METNITGHQERDIYGNLILDSFWTQVVHKPTDTIKDANESVKIDRYHGAVVMTYGKCKTCTYDEKNNPLEEHLISRTGEVDFISTQYSYIYTDDDLLTEQIKLTTEQKTNCTQKKIVYATKTVFAYDTRKNIISETRYQKNKLPDNISISEIDFENSDFSICFKHKNTYNNHGQLISVLSDTENGSTLKRYEYNGNIVTTLWYKNMVTASEERTEFCYTSKNEWEERTYNQRHDVLQKIVKRRMIDGREARHISSPAEDGFIWQITEVEKGADGCVDSIYIEYNGFKLIKAAVESMYKYILGLGLASECSLVITLPLLFYMSPIDEAMVALINKYEKDFGVYTTLNF